MRRAALLWTLAAVVGVVLVAGVTLAASRISSQGVGLSAEPVSAGDSLAPARGRTATATATATPSRTRRARRNARRPRVTATPRPRATATPVPAAPAPAPTVDDKGGSSGSSGSDDS